MNNFLLNLVGYILVGLADKCETLKSTGKIDNYNVNAAVCNYHIAEDGVPEYDIVFNREIMPIELIQWVDINITITPEGYEFKTN